MDYLLIWMYAGGELRSRGQGLHLKGGKFLAVMVAVRLVFRAGLRAQGQDQALPGYAMHAAVQPLGIFTAWGCSSAPDHRQGETPGPLRIT